MKATDDIDGPVACFISVNKIYINIHKKSFQCLYPQVNRRTHQLRCGYESRERWTSDRHGVAQAELGCGTHCSDPCQNKRIN